MSVNVGHKTALDLLRMSCIAGGLVVDAGAFPGTLTRLLREDGWNVIALDKKPDRGITMQHRFGSGEYDQEGLNTEEETFLHSMQAIGVEVRCADLETEPWPIMSQTVDGIVLTEVIEHLWVDPLFALNEINRILKRDTGVLLLSTPNLLSIRNRGNFLRGRIGRVIEHPLIVFLKKARLGHVGHVRLYAPAELETMLRVFGFDPQLFFYSFDYWEPAATQSQDPKGKHAQMRASLWCFLCSSCRWLIQTAFRSPKSYLAACVATSRVCIERIVPRYRSHMFVIAKKIRDVDYREFSTTEITARIQIR